MTSIEAPALALHQKERPGFWNDDFYRDFDSPTLLWADSDEHVAQTFEHRQFWSQHPEDTKRIQYMEWQWNSSEKVFVAKTSPSEKAINHYNQYTNDSVLKMFASQKKPIPQWILHLLLQRSILEKNSGSQSDLDSMSYKEVLTEIGTQFSSALEALLEIYSDTNDRLESYGTPESRARGLLGEFRKAQGMPEMISSLAMPRSECSGPSQFTRDTGTTGGPAL